MRPVMDAGAGARLARGGSDPRERIAMMSPSCRKVGLALAAMTLAVLAPRKAFAQG
jgi:hypothetical protein